MLTYDDLYLLKVIVLHKGGTVGRGGGFIQYTPSFTNKNWSQEKMYHNGKNSISTVPCGYACQVFECILHNC